MGTDKALMRFNGLPLIQLAVQKLRLTCSEGAILGNRPEYERFGELVPDRLLRSGPLGGIEAALHHASNKWILILPVDVPLIPGSMLKAWAWHTMHDDAVRPAACCFEVAKRLEPLVALLHKEMLPSVTAALDRGERKVASVLQDAALQAVQNPNGTRQDGLRIDSLDAEYWRDLWKPTMKQLMSKHLWFVNLNTPAEFAEAEKHLAALDT